MTQTTLHIAVTIAMAALGTLLTRFTPFIVFHGDRETPAYVKYLGKALPGAALGLLVVYCFKDVNVLTGAHGLPELIALAVITALHGRRNMLLSIAAGTVVYMLLVNFVF